MFGVMSVSMCGTDLRAAFGAAIGAPSEAGIGSSMFGAVSGAIFGTLTPSPWSLGTTPLRTGTGGGVVERGRAATTGSASITRSSSPSSSALGIRSRGGSLTLRTDGRGTQGLALMVHPDEQRPFRRPCAPMIDESACSARLG